MRKNVIQVSMKFLITYLVVIVGCYVFYYYFKISDDSDNRFPMDALVSDFDIVIQSTEFILLLAIVTILLVIFYVATFDKTSHSKARTI